MVPFSKEWPGINSVHIFCVLCIVIEMIEYRISLISNIKQKLVLSKHLSSSGI